jgi:AraC-like DNA-binding protein
MRKTFFSLILLLGSSCFIFNSSIAQDQDEIDSIKNLISKSNKDTNQIKTYITLCEFYSKIQLDSTIYYAQKTIKLSEQLNFDYGIGRGFQLQGFAFSRKGEYDKALNAYEKTVETFGKNGKSILWAFSLSTIAGIYSATDNFDTAILIYKDALDYLESTDNLFAESKVRTNYARVFSRMGNYPSAIKNLNQSKKYFHSIHKYDWVASIDNSRAVIYNNLGLTDSAIAIYNRIFPFYLDEGNYFRTGELLRNLGALYAEIGDTKAALISFNEGMKYVKQVNNDRGIAILQMNKAKLYIEMDKLDSAKVWLDQSRHVFELTNASFPLSYNLIYTGEYFLKRNDPKLAKKFFLESYQLSKTLSLDEPNMEAIEYLSSVYEKLNDNSSALKYFKIHKRVSDSLLKQRSQQVHKIAEDSFNQEILIAEQNLKIEKQALINKKQRYTFITILTSVVLLIFILLIVVYYKRKTREKNKALHKFNVIIDSKLNCPEKKPLQPKNKTSEIADKIVEHLGNENILRDPYYSQSKLTKDLNTNTTYVSNAFTKYIKKSFNEYMNNGRSLLARKMVEATNLSFVVISRNCGFNSYGTFIKAFKNLTGMTPKEYRKFSK